MMENGSFHKHRILHFLVTVLDKDKGVCITKQNNVRISNENSSEMIVFSYEWLHQDRFTGNFYSHLDSIARQYS